MKIPSVQDTRVSFTIACVAIAVGALALLIAVQKPSVGDVTRASEWKDSTQILFEHFLDSPKIRDKVSVISVAANKGLSKEINNLQKITKELNQKVAELKKLEKLPPRMHSQAKKLATLQKRIDSLCRTLTPVCDSTQ
jgi:hypothetical protein